MDREELLERLRGVEWDDFEVKAAQGGIPEDSYKTVSAFSNSSGGWLVFGAAERRGTFEVVGVADPDGMQNSFLGACRSAEKFSRTVEVRSKLYNLDGLSVLAFYVKPATRFDKPVKVKVDRRWETFVRSGGGDHRCSPVEEARFLRDASHDTFDSLVCEHSSLADLDAGSLDWYRGLMGLRDPQKAYPDRDRSGYLEANGLLRQTARVTNAAVLMFGNDASLARLKPGGLVDFRLFHTAFSEVSPEQRWDDRELSEQNLVKTLRAFVERFARLVEQPFRLEPGSVERTADSPDYRAVREALVNLLAHQDYSDALRTARILWFPDRAYFENPGDSYTGLSEMLDGGVSESRNPLLVRLLRQAGFAEQAGTGIPAIVRTWRTARRTPPEIGNDPGRKLFRLTLGWSRLTGHRDDLWYRRLGVDISEDAGRLLSFSREHGAFSLTKARLATGLSGREIAALVTHLVTQQLLAVEGSNDEVLYSLSPHLAALWTETPAGEPPEASGGISVSGRGSTGGVNGGVNGGVTGGVNGGVNGGEPGEGAPEPGVEDLSRSARIERLIANQPGLRVPQLAEAAELPPSSVEKLLAVLRADGRVEFRGAPKVGGYYLAKRPGKPRSKRKTG